MRTQRAELESFNAKASKPATKPNEHGEPGDDLPVSEQRFLDLLRSNPESFVIRKNVSETADENGKRKAVYTTLSRQVSVADVAAHLDGKTCLVLKPELADGTCLWAMIDHDVYSPQRCQIIRDEIQTLRLPLHPFRSKSGGLHSTIFFRSPQPSLQVRALLAKFAAQLGECPDCEIFPKPVAPGKKPFGIAMPFFGERGEFESFEPVFYDGPLNGHVPGSGELSDLPAYGVRLPEGVDFGELLKGRLQFQIRDEAGGISYDYHGISGQPCLIQLSPHSANKYNPRCSRFFVKDGYVCHQCFDSDCQAETEPKTQKALEAIGIDFRAEFPSAGLPQNAVPWPEPLALEAFHGLAGKVVRAIEPHSEADSAALLVQFLVAFGNIIGRSSFFSVEDVEHSTNCFTLIVGDTSKARKGTSWSRIRRIFDRLEEDRWAELRILGGIGSGEGIIEQVRDAVVKGNEVDAGAPDKRLLLNETEFAQVLAVNKREGNTASEVLRKAWDGTTLQTLTRQRSSLKASGAHVSLIGHITRDELLRHLDQTEVANGLMNRFLICCARRSKYLPEGGSMSNEEISTLARELALAVEFGKESRELRRDAEARKLWHDIYPDLSEGRPGLFGALIARAEAQVLRVSMLYALLDRSDAIRREHLEAARSVWRYCEDSARHIFGDALGNPVADEILRALRANPSGLTRTEINDLFGRHRSKNYIGGALSMLMQRGLAKSTTESTQGRPVERWRAKQREKVK